MRSSIISSFGLAEDGHPCEAALEFRRAAIRNNIVEEISLNGMDLAVAFAWLGKAISRTIKLDAWKQTSVDPNTWEMVWAMALDVEVRRQAIEDALFAEAQANFTRDLEYLRRSSAFQSAAEKAQATLSVSTSHNDILFWMGELQHIAQIIKGPEIKLNVAKATNLVSLATFRKTRTEHA